jgi:hypothetical protein
LLELRPAHIKQFCRKIDTHSTSGGHLGRKADGDAGITVMWRGLMRLYEDVEMLRAHKVVLGNDYAS